MTDLNKEEKEVEVVDFNKYKEEKEKKELDDEIMKKIIERARNLKF